MDRQIEVSRFSRWKKWWWIPVMGVIAAGLVILLPSFGRGNLRVKQEHVVFARVGWGEFEEYIAVNGTIEPRKTVLISALEGGIVEEKYVEDGARVKKGDALFKLSNPDLELEFMNRETALLDQLNNLRNTRIQLEQSHYNYRQQQLEVKKNVEQLELLVKANESLMRDSLLPVNEYRSQLIEFGSLKEKLSLLDGTTRQSEEFKNFQQQQLAFSSSLIHRSLESLKSGLDKLVAKAPASGLLTGLNVEVGQSITKGSRVAEIDRLEGYRVNALVDELYIHRIQKGIKAVVEINSRAFHLEVDKIYPQVSNGYFRVDLVFTGAVPEDIRYGQSLPLKISLGMPARTLLLKRGGFYQKTGGAWVFVREGNKALKRSTSFGRQNPDFLEILSGLKEGEEVIISSYDTFADAEVLILE